MCYCCLSEGHIKTLREREREIQTEKACEREIVIETGGGGVQCATSHLSDVSEFILGSLSLNSNRRSTGE